MTVVTTIRPPDRLTECGWLFESEEIEETDDDNRTLPSQPVLNGDFLFRADARVPLLTTNPPGSGQWCARVRQPARHRSACPTKGVHDRQSGKTNARRWSHGQTDRPTDRTNQPTNQARREPTSPPAKQAAANERQLSGYFTHHVLPLLTAAGLSPLLFTVLSFGLSCLLPTNEPVEPTEPVG